MDPMADTEWNDVLRQKGILPEKEAAVTEEDLVNMVQQTIEEKSQGKTFGEMSMEELNDLEDNIDEEEEQIFEAYRRQRMHELKTTAMAAKFGDVLEISKVDYVREVNQAGEGVWVVLLVYKDSVMLCKLIQQFFADLARKFPAVKFVKSVSTVCIPDYPDKNLPTVFVYVNGDMKKQFVGPAAFGDMKLTRDDLEWMLAETGAIKTELEERPSSRRQVPDVMMRAMCNADDDDD